MNHTITELDERMLNVARFLIVVKVFGDLLVREMASEPGVPPKEERHEDDEPSGHEEQDLLGAGYGALRLRRRRMSAGGFGCGRHTQAGNYSRSRVWQLAKAFCRRDR